jgi:EAL domain-containing protein (putative c-di-GMP-specific phosphodiesterase class I)
VESLEELRAFAPNVDLVLEIHETALAQADYIVWLRNRLMEINVGLAYDDFGAGQARLFELAEAPPHYLKFDRRFITGIDQAPNSRQRLVASLVAAARELLVRTIAEGVETPEEAAACTRAGFSHAQGFHFGRPAAVDFLYAT